ncbi:RidA family protein [Nakamurella flavida]|uniref:RidA family protein n=1 Tax=Nakamurella flavida TaxID=363630 RepID=A0A938YMP0_9ACTN|nr:RidA family protein [Nakamurella flavida]MBM9478074.1 RidA family protein [Nakamurella flavida]MDP9778705.1 enamine deaminase RidA (YjgF/YER057c/UK114 family) [Nakamurella flavida]
MTDRRAVGSGAPWEAIVGYSRAVRVGPFIAVAGTTASGPDGAVGGGEVAAQTREVLTRIEAALGQLGASLADVVRTRIFLTDIARWEDVGRVHGEFFGDIRPAATMVEVNALIEPGLLVEIEADAIVMDDDSTKGG